MQKKNRQVARRRFLQGMLASPLFVSMPYAYGQQAAIKVGGTLPLTGPLGATGLVHKIAQEIFVEQINKRGGLLGRPVELIVLDDQSQAANTRTLYEKLITADKVDFVMGPYATSSILAAMGVAQRYGKLFIQSSLGDPNLANYDMHFPALPLGPNPRLTDAEILFDAWASTSKPPKSISIVTSKFPSALDISKGAQEVAEKRGITVKLFLEYEFGTKDFGPIASRVKDANSDLFWMGSLGLEGNQFIDSVKKLDYLPPRQFFLFPAPGPTASNSSADRATSLTWFEEHAPFDKNRGAAELIAAFGERARAGGLPWPYVDYQAAAEFASWQILEGAVVATKSLDDKVLADWLKKNEVATVLGRQKFDGKNNGGPERTCIKQVREGKWNVVWPLALAAPGRRLEGPSL